MHPPRHPCIALAIAATILVPTWAQRVPHLIPVNDRILAPLREAGVDPSDEGALINALHRPDISLRAAVVLGSRPANAAVDAALKEIARPAKEKLTSQEETNLGAAVYALARHGEFGWADEVARRLPAIKEPVVRIWLAGDLALAGRYEGWTVIKSTITSPQQSIHTVRDALSRVEYFEGMKDDAGNPVTLAVELDRMLAQAPPDHRKAIVEAMPLVTPPKEKRGPGK